MTTPDSSKRPLLITFLSYYVRSGFPIAIAAVPALMWFRGESDAASLVVGAAIGAAITLAAAALTFRRARAASAYVPPPPGRERGTGHTRPASAVTAPEAQGRRRGLSAVWWTLLLATGAALGWCCAVVFADTVEFDAPSGAIAAVGVIIGSMLWLMVAITFLWSRPSLARNARIAAERPGALVLTAYFGYDGISAGIVLRRVCNAASPWWRARLRMITTLVVDDAGLEFWVGRDRQPLYAIPWTDIGEISPNFVEVDTGSASSVNLGIDVDLRVRQDDAMAGWLSMSFLVGRSDMWITFPHRSRAIIETVASAIAARRPGADDHFRGHPIAEVRDILATLSAEGDDETTESLLDQLQEWLDARGGRAPRGGEWLEERLALRASER